MPENNDPYQIINPFQSVNSQPEGLNQQEITFRLQKYGLNQLTNPHRQPLLIRFLKEFKDLMVIILLIAATLALFTNEILDAIMIYLVVLANSLISFIQKNKAEKAIEALQKMVAPQARVIRNNGHQQIIASSQIVPGDIVLLSEGDKIPADAIIFESNEFSAQESLLSGESVPVNKFSFNFQQADNYSTIQNFIFAGTSVAHGNAKALVVRTGMNTEFGKIANLTQETKQDSSPLEKELRQIGLFTANITIAISIIIFLIDILILKGEIIDTLLFAISLAVAAVPEGLPATITIALALGVQRLARKNAIIKQLSATETLGATTVICTDKTGTLTKNEMTVKSLFFDDLGLQLEGAGYIPTGKVEFFKSSQPFHQYDLHQSTEQNLQQFATHHPHYFRTLEWLLITATLCNNAELVQQNNQYQVLGDPTEGSLLTMTEKIGLNIARINSAFSKIHELPFDSGRKIMSQIVQEKATGKYYVLTKGAPENLIQLCDQRLHLGRPVIFTKDYKNAVLELNADYAHSAFRTIALAFKEIPHRHLNELLNTDNYQDLIGKVEKDFIFLGLSALFDPPRPEVKEAIKLTKKAGIRTFVLTGDHGFTAQAIAKQIDLINPSWPTEIITGADIDTLSHSDLKAKISNTELNLIFARISPAHKLLIVSLFKELGEIVAVTGDGVNDAPALKRADIGIAMGLSGTDVTREAANIVLADDSYNSIVNAIKEGRTIYQNLHKFIYYIFSSNIGEVTTIFFALILTLPNPLTAVLILTVNLATDLFPALALGMEPVEKNIMNSPPRPPATRIMNRQFIFKISYVGVLLGLCMLALNLSFLILNGWTFGQSVPPELISKIQTLTFAGLVIIQVFNSFNAKSDTKSIFSFPLWHNPKLLGANLLSVLICISVVHIPLLQEFFKTTALQWTEWLLLIAISATIIITEEVRKIITSWARKAKLTTNSIKHE